MGLWAFGSCIRIRISIGMGVLLNGRFNMFEYEICLGLGTGWTPYWKDIPFASAPIWARAMNYY